MDYQETVGSGGAGTESAAATEATDTEVQAEVTRHLAGLLHASSAWKPDVVARIIWRSLVAHRWAVADALRKHLEDQSGGPHAELNYLQEIEKSAIELLEFAPDAGVDESTGRNLVAEEAARIFSRVRLILPKEHGAEHWEEDVDVSDNESAGTESRAAS